MISESNSIVFGKLDEVVSGGIAVEIGSGAIWLEDPDGWVVLHMHLIGKLASLAHVHADDLEIGVLLFDQVSEGGVS